MSSNMHNGEGQIKGHAPMSDHLPECEAYRIECGGGCICHNVHACEQRVAKTGAIYYAEGFTAALDAAREAVAGLTDLDECNLVNSDCWCMEHYCFCEHRGKAQALAAIDALREGKQ